MQVQSAAIPKMDQPLTSQRKEVNSAKTEQAQNKATTPKQVSDAKEQMETEKTSVYLKVLSRLENMHKNDELPEMALENFMKAVNQRLEETSDSDKKILINSQEAKDLSIKKFEDIKEKITEGLDTDEDAIKVFALLKQPHFVKLMEGEDNQPSKTYGPDGQSPDGKANTIAKKEVQSKQPMEAQGAIEKIETGNNVKQAIETLKSMQSNANSPLANQKPTIAA